MKKSKLSTSRFLFTLLIMLLMISAGSAGQVLTSYNIFNLQDVSEVAVSPDQQHIAYTVNIPRPFSDTAGTDYRELYVYTVSSGEITPLLTGKSRVLSISWTPGGKVSFRYAGKEARGLQVFSIDPLGGEPVQLTRFERSVGQYEFTDNRTIFFTASADRDTLKSQLLEKGFNAEVYEEEYSDINLYKYDLQTHETIQVTTGVTVYDFSVSPDGRFAAAAIAEKNLVDYSYMFKRIFLVDLETGEKSLLVDNPGKLGGISWSPDGKRIAFIAASDINDAVAGSMFVADVPNNQPFEGLKNYADGMRASIIYARWKDNNTLLFVSEEGVDMVLSEQDVESPSRRILINPGNAVFRSFSRTGGLIALSGNTPEHPNELFSFDLKEEKLNKLTGHNPWLGEISTGRQEMIVYNARDGLDIEAVLIYPVGYEPGKAYPLITYIHGGPEAANQNGWVTRYSIWGQVAAARGYFFFMPNYRAGSGRGVDFTMEGFGDLVGKEYDDVLDGIDHLINLGFVDKNRVGIGGGSYGGYFSAWSATRHTERFAASVVFVGISNQISKRSTTDIPWEDYFVHWGFWTHENMEKVWDASPVKYAPGSITPTLILHGKEDPRVHPSQSLELYRKLKLHGEAPVRLIWYPGEGHGNSRNTSKLDYSVRTMEWFDYYLKDKGPRNEMPDKYIDFEID
jgi:dipeptidyl aminopeptidase/acylaminoacyl peptidase